MADHAVRKATTADISVLAATLAHAFDDDPLTVWMFPDERRRRRQLPRFFRSLLRTGLPFAEVYTAGDGRARRSGTHRARSPWGGPPTPGWAW